MIQKGDSVTLWRQTRVRDPTGCLVEHFADRIFEPKPSVHSPDDCEILCIGRPIGVENVFEDLTGSASSQGHTRQRAATFGPIQLATERKGQLARGRDCQYPSQW